MAINKKLIVQEAAAELEIEGLLLHLDANDVDSYDGDGDIWYDVHNFPGSTTETSLIPSTASTEFEVDLIFDPNQVYYTDTNYALEQDNTIWKGNADNSAGTHEGEVYMNNFFESGDTGKYYFEVESLEGTHSFFGFTDPTKYTAGQGLSGGVSKTSFRNHYFFGVSSTHKYESNGASAYSSLSTGINTSGTVLAVAIDVATRKVWMGNVSSGTVTWFSSGNPSTGANPLMTIPATWSFYQPLVADGSYSSASARYAWWELNRTASATTLPTGFSYMNGAVKGADLALHLDADSFPESDEAGYNNTPTTWTALTGGNATITSCEFDSELGNSLKFNGTTSEVVFPANVVGTNGIATTELWVKGSSLSSPTGNDLIYQNTNGGFFYVIYVKSSGLTVRVANSDNSAQTDVSYAVSNFNSNDWYHITATFNGASNPVKLYVNGEKVNEGNAQSTFRILSFPNTIGAEKNSDVLTFLGEIGQVRTYTSTLSQAQIRQNYNFTKGSYPNGNNGSLGSGTTNQKPSFHSAGYFDFDGTNDMVDLSGQPNFPTSVNQLNQVKCISAWIKPETTSANMYIFSVSSTTQTKDYFTFDLVQSTDWTGTPDLRVRVSNGGSSNRLDALANISTTNSWVHVLAQLGDSGVELYLNGVSQSVNYTTSGSATNSWWIKDVSYDSSVNTLIGQYRAPTSGSNASNSYGRMSKIKCYSRVLTQAEIDALHSEGE